jgi:HEAT repeat protein
LVVALSVVSLAACGVTAEKIEKWKGTEKGPKKLKEAVADPKLDPALRGQAFAALVEINLLDDAVSGLKQTTPEQGAPVAAAAAPRIIELAGKGAGAPTKVQVAAKDALFELHPMTSGATRDAVEDALIAWTTQDLVQRLSLGGHSSEKILTTIGPRAEPALEKLLDPKSPSLPVVAALIGRVAPEPRKAAVVDQLMKSGVSEPVLLAVSRVGGPAASAALLKAASASGPLQEKAILALGQQPGGPDAAALEPMLAVAGNRNAAPKAREAAFQALERMGMAAVLGLIKLFNDPDEVVRWRSVEAALAAGKEKAVLPVLEGLPDRAYKDEDLDSYVVHDLKLIGKAAVDPLTQAKGSKSAVARKIAERALAHIK